MDLSGFSIGLGIRLFFIGMVAISAMFLPGISGSMLLLIFGAYIPVITAIKGVLSFQFSYIPALAFFGLGVIAGAVSVVKLIRVCLEKYRTQTVYMILGMMIGSFYAIVMGPTTLKVPQAAMNIGSFQAAAALVGVLLVLAMQFIRDYQSGAAVQESREKKIVKNRACKECGEKDQMTGSRERRENRSCCFKALLPLKGDGIYGSCDHTCV